MKNIFRPPFLPTSDWSGEVLPLDRRFWLWHVLPILLLGTLLLIVDQTEMDLGISRFFFNASTKGFPYNYSFWFKKIFHDAADLPIYVVIFLVLLLALRVTLEKGAAFRTWKYSLWYLTFAMLLSPLVISILKSLTDHYCPDQISYFGGRHLYHHLFQPIVERNPRKGQCWPSGHAGLGFLLFAWYFFFHWMNRRKLAIRALLLALLLGNLLGLVQVWRGEHFLSHQFWTTLFCWSTCLLVYGLFRLQWQRGMATHGHQSETNWPFSYHLAPPSLIKHSTGNLNQR